MNQPITLTLPARSPQRANVAYAANMWTRAKSAKQGKRDLAMLIKAQLGTDIAPFTLPVGVTIRAYYGGTMRDIDAPIKAILDGLVVAGVLVDDDPTHVSELHCFVARVPKREERVEVYIGVAAVSEARTY